MAKITPEEILEDFKYSAQYLAPIHREMEKDFEYEAGKQWKDEDKATLERLGVKALTINKLRPIIKLMSGIERQSKSDFVAFPEGEEDGLVSDIATSLLKNTVKTSKAERKLSTQFKRGSICGMDFIEPYIDYTYDMLEGVLRIRNVNPMRVFFDPDCEEYDLSDGKFMIVFSPDLTKDKLYEMFPEKKTKIDQLKSGKIQIDGLETAVSKGIQKRDYDKLSEAKTIKGDFIDGEKYDCLAYQYKSITHKYFVLDKELKTVTEVDNLEAGKEYCSQNPNAQTIERSIPEFRIAYLIGKEIFEDEVLWTYPKWKGWSIIPYFADWLTVPLDDQDLQFQGIIRNLKDLQEEYNKRRTQELRHLNSSVGSGIMAADDALSVDEEAKIKKYGSSPGIFIKYKAGTTGKPERIPPPPLSTAHAQLAAENAQDLKEASGVNADLLANSNTDQSGKAILLKQKQGLVMVQEYLDNYSETKKLLGTFLLSQFGEIFTIEKARKILGEGFIQKYQEFKKPVLDPMGQPMLDEVTQNLKTETDEDKVNEILNGVLNDSANISKYDVTIGEGAYSETVKMSNYLMLMDMVGKGLQIPADVLITESTLPQGSKQKIIAAIERQQELNAMTASKQPITKKG